MAGKEKYTAQQIIDALIQARGMKTVAARNLGCDYNTIVRYINTYATVKQALDETLESLGDNVESTLLAKALGRRDAKGDWIEPPDTACLIFLAKTHPSMRRRGYAERQLHEHSGIDGAPIPVAIAITKMKIDEL